MPARINIGAALAAGALSALLALVVPAGADAAGRSLGTSEDAIETDGSRLAVYKSGSTKLTVIDDARRRRFRISIDPTCEPGDMADGGLISLGCRGNAGRVRLLIVNVLRGTSFQVPETETGSPRWYDPDYEAFDELGRYWLSGESSASGHRLRTYLNWRTGEKRTTSEDGPYVPRDLDSPDLDPLAPRRGTDNIFLSDDPFSVTFPRRNRHGGLADLTLFRDGTATRLGTRVALLSRCAVVACWSVTLGGGVVTWSEGRIARAYVIRGGRRLSWKFRRVISPSPAPWLQHTRRALYHTVYRGLEGDPYALYEVPWKD